MLQQLTNIAPPGNTVPKFGGTSYTDPSATNQFVMSNTTSFSTEMFNSDHPISQGVTQTYLPNETLHQLEAASRLCQVLVMLQCTTL